MFYLDSRLKQLIGSDGLVSAQYESNLSDCIKVAESIAKRMLGCTLDIRNRKFILTNLELYYGGIGDMAHDWYRANFPQFYEKKVCLRKEQAALQIEDGLRIYFNQRGGGNHKRMDLVIGPKGVAISLLIRNVAREDGTLVGSPNGNPAIILRENGMNVSDDDFGLLLSDSTDIQFHDTHTAYVKNTSDIIVNKRYISSKGYAGFDNGIYAQHEWNFRIVGSYGNK